MSEVGTDPKTTFRRSAHMPDLGVLATLGHSSAETGQLDSQIFADSVQGC